ncbi:Flagellar hook-basal body protein precursor [Novosphingobium resinovorum]|jgi:flagellar hook protein FlgE|uniref:Flagellar hook protein FlgE n=1 Tax=Novosphingobium resinovorum TaxID=158500 RepID=A0A031JTM1_9SPHN|nr:flagellar hook protein FlgE [Novosphingobium resinovorum]EZP80153.1 Flagellar hook-basal body protein precursor [Novosphingobium resinovorum]
MSLYSALYAGVSGLSAQSSAMATVADNITNVNTVGYKGTSAQFESLVNGGSVSSTYSAGGVTATAKSLISKQGLLQASSSLTDIAIDGAGFFVVRSSADASGATAFTRAGSFTTDSSGYLRNTSGYYLMGWPLDTQGNYANNGAISSLEPIRPTALTGAAAPTTSIELRANLDSTSEAVADYDAGDMSSGDVDPQFSRSVEIYDSQGTAHTLTFNFVKTGANQWAAEITGDPTDISSVNGDPVGANGMIASTTVSFNADGSLDLGTPATALFGSLQLEYNNGAAAMPISLDLGSNAGLDGLTQFGSTSALLSSTVDGGMLGTVASVKISDTGVVSAVFDDGTSRAIYQLPIATFQNPDGLTRIGGNAYIVSEDSGNFALNEPGTVGGGKISASMLEASNVDLASEFSNMILFQRAYSASSKIITTVDDMLQEVSNLKR